LIQKFNFKFLPVIVIADIFLISKFKRLMKQYLFLLFLSISFLSFSQNQVVYSTMQQSHDGGFNPLQDIVAWFVSEITYGILIESFLEKDTPMHDAELTPYPFFNPGEGDYTYDKEHTSFRVEAFGSMITDIHKNITGEIGGRIRFLKRMSVDLSYTHLSGIPELSGDFHSQTRLMFNYYRIRTRQFELWYGLGALFSENKKYNPAVNFNVGAELFLPPKISVSGQGDWGYFEQGVVKNYQLQLNYHISRWRLYAGLKNYRITGYHLNTLQAGLKYYF